MSVHPTTDHFAAVPAAWEEQQRAFSLTARAVYVQLLLSMNRKTGEVHAGLRALGKSSGITKDAVNRALHELAGELEPHPRPVIGVQRGRNGYAGTVVTVLLRRGAVQPDGTLTVQPDGTVPRRHVQPDGTACPSGLDSTQTAHTPSPAVSPDRGLEGYLDEEEGGTAEPSGLPASGSDVTPGKAKAKCAACFGTGICDDGDGVGPYACSCTIQKPVSGR
ncbi:MAG: hypothetical protein Q7W16_07930 [Coriobacteriia bacterium]|nr:hypothetical protein [Coriobacteriia bacterium]